MSISKTQAKLKARILDTIYSQAPISRVDIAKQTGITPATTSSITGELINEQFIRELGEDEASNKVGRKKILLDIRANHLFYIGAEISGKQFTYVLTDNLGNLIDQKKVAVTSALIKEKGIQIFNKELGEFISRNPSHPIQGIGIAVPGRYIGNYKITTNNQLWEEFDLKKIEEEFPYPLYFANNVNAMALSKRLFSKNKNNENFIFFHSGRGMHCSYIYNGQIYGRDNIAIGEIGHTVVSPFGEVCECGRKGCLQTYASETWLIKKARILFNTSPTSYLRNIVTDESDIQTNILLTAYDLGDQGVVQLLETAIHYLAQSILNLSIVIDSSRIYLHSPLLSHPKLAEILMQDVLYEPLILFTKPPLVEIVEYNEFTGASAGVALALHNQFLSN